MLKKTKCSRSVDDFKQKFRTRLGFLLASSNTSSQLITDRFACLKKKMVINYQDRHKTELTLRSSQGLWSKALPMTKESL